MKKVLILLLALLFAVHPVHAEELSGYIDAAFLGGIISGNENGDFQENKSATRAEFTVMLTRFLGISGMGSTFSDVKEDDWFSGAVSAATKHGLIFGDGNSFFPHALIKYEDAVTILGRYYKASGGKRPDGVSPYAAAYYAYALEKGIADEEKNPQEFATKGEILSLLYRYEGSTGSARFEVGYPRVSTEAEFSSISVDMKTNMPCTVYYSVCEAGMPPVGTFSELCKTEEKEITVSFNANISKSYDIYLRAGSGRTAVIKNVQPFAISSGDGSEAQPYVIYTKQQLLQIKRYPSAHYVLGADIDAAGIGTIAEEFSGVLDGAGFEISGLKIDGAENVGLFGKISGGKVKNLAVSANVSGKKNVGIIAGINEGVISDCTVSGEVSAATNSAGGICGINRGTVTNCLSAVYSVSAGSFAGGISGQNFTVIENSLSAVYVVASDMCAGGISGTNEAGEIKNCLCASMTVYDTMTKNSGRLTINKKDGITKNNYCYNGINSNEAYGEPGANSQNGLDVSWNEILGDDLYKNMLKWDMSRWEKKDGGYRLTAPTKAAAPRLAAGETAYLPKEISTERELREVDKNEAGHYILTHDIALTMPWKTICARDGFSGTFDGDGHTIYNLNLKGESGMFSNITGGTVKNLNIKKATASPDSVGGILAACNFGYIENCSIYGMLETKKAGSVGGAVGENYGAVTGCSVYVDINSKNDNATVGGICAENSGIIDDCKYIGGITSTGENAVVGAVCGYDTAGYIFESVSDAQILVENVSGYTGGICGIAAGTQVYKCASGGKIVARNDDMLYSGGVCALAEGAVIYNCYSVADIHTSATAGYVGGVCGFNSGANLQNTYSAGNVIASSDSFAGGICGFSENGFVMQNVSINPAINGGSNTAAIVGGYEMSEVSDNYSCERTVINSSHIVSGEGNGSVKSLNALKNADFYFRPLSSGGLLGWSCDKYGENVWKYDTKSARYAFPLLSGVDGQGGFKTPAYK